MSAVHSTSWIVFDKTASEDYLVGNPNTQAESHNSFTVRKERNLQSFDAF